MNSLLNLGEGNSVAGTDLVYSLFVAGTNLGTLFLLQEQIWGLCFFWNLDLYFDLIFNLTSFTNKTWALTLTIILTLTLIFTWSLAMTLLFDSDSDFVTNIGFDLHNKHDIKLET